MKTALAVTTGIVLLAISELAAATLHVSTGSMNATPPYDSWATAARNIQDAVDAAPSGAVVLVTNGVYAGGLTVGKPLTLLSANGPEFTTIDGGGTNRCVAITSLTSVSGFTMTNGWTLTDGGAVWSTYASAFLTNCILSGSCASNGGGAYEATLYNCVLSGNCASNGSGGAAFVCNVYNCTLAGNSAARGGGAFYGSLYNSIIYYNSAPSGSNYAQIWNMTNCCTTPEPGIGAGHITSDPLFVDFAAGNLRLQSTSPCIDAGNNAYAYGVTDLDGNPRLAGAAVDIGAYEFQQASAPVINLQPLSQTVYAGSNVTFTVGTAGSLPLSWQWKFDGTAVLDATNSGLTLASVTTNQAGAYSVIITNTLGVVTSQVAVLTVIDSKPSITVQPLSQTVVAGSNVAFVVGAVGSLPLSWQWQFKGVAIASATASRLALASVTTDQTGGYSAVITNLLGSTTSQVAVLTVLPGLPPTITLEPLSQTVSADSSVTFTAGASGFPPLYWQWLLNGTAIPDATNSGLTLTSVTVGQAGMYSVIVSNAVGSVTSADAVLIVRTPGTKYAWQDSATPTPPYSSWATAAHVIQDAVDLAVPGDEIIVTNGVYATGGRTAAGGPSTNRVAVDKPITIRSVNGPGVTVILGYQVPGTVNGKEAIRCIYLADGAVLSGFTLTSGATGAFSADWSPYDPYGGGASCASTNAVITNCVLTGNSAFGPGAGASGGTLNNCTLSGNSGAFGAGSAGGTLNNCTLSNNSARMGGGAYQAVLNHCTLSGNSVTDEGGAAAESVLNNCIITGNSAETGGGAYQGTLNNCALSGNSAAQGGGASQATLNNCTVTGNSATGLAGGTDFGILNNCIVYYNTAPTGPNYYGGTNFAYCCTTPLPPGPGNLADEPLLASSTHLSAQSPCIGRGAAAYAGGVDIDGDTWLNPPCIGADQFVSGQTTGPLAVGISGSYTSVGTGFAAPFRAIIDGRLTASAWDFGDGILVSNRPYLSHAWAAPGDYVVRLIGYNDTYPSGNLATFLVHVAAADLYYVDAANPTPVPPYTNWAGAARNIQDAVDAGTQMGRLVLVAQGVYGCGGRAVNGSLAINRVVVSQGVEVRSVGGPADTVITGAASPTGGNGDGAIRCVYLGANAVLSGFTLKNGHTPAVWQAAADGGGGGAWCEVSGVVTNCTLTGNSAVQGGGAYGGTLNDCSLSDNSADYLGGGASECSLNNCRLSRNTASQGGGAEGSTLKHCTVSGNSASQGGGAQGGTLNNCVLNGNSAYWGGGVYEATVNNSTFTGNSAANGGGAYAGQGSSVLNNCTLTGNWATNDGGGTYSGVLNNCIVYYNVAPNGPNYSGGSICTYSCTTPQPGPSGNFEAEPLLASATHLSTQSPCIGRGSAVYASGVDIDGEAWQNPPCIGADQFVEGQNIGSLTVEISASYTNVGTGFVVPFQGLIEGQLAASAWDFGDGMVVSNRPYASHAWAAPGDYIVRLTGYSDSYPSGVSATAQMHVAASEVYYVDGANTTPEPPYTSRTGAATNIQDAIDAGTQLGRVVLVADGVYSSGGRSVDGLATNRVVVSEGVEVRSMNGPTATVIEGAAPLGGLPGDPGVRCAYIGTKAMLSGFTLTNGYAFANSLAAGNGGGAWCEVSGIVTNCTLSGNAATENGGGAYGGTLNGCILSSNRAGAYGGGASGATLNHCRLSGNSASSGGGAYDATLNSCTLTGNLGYSYGGGGAFQSTLNNCVLTGNSSGAGGAVMGGTLNNCTLSSNPANFGGGAVWATLNNCILYYDGSISCTLNFCCTAAMPTDGTGNITNEPLFVNLAGGDFHLQSTSPCINAGNKGFVSGTTDLDGNPRIVAATVDMGAYEFQGGGSVISSAWLQQYGLPTDGSADYLDSDGDGMSNWQEWLCGTDPTNPNSVLHLLSATAAGSNITVTWQSVTGVSYFLKRGANASTWLALEPTNMVLIATNIVGQAGTTAYSDTNALGAGCFFYRVGVNYP